MDNNYTEIIRKQLEDYGICYFEVRRSSKVGTKHIYISGDYYVGKFDNDESNNLNELFEKDKQWTIDSQRIDKNYALRMEKVVLDFVRLDNCRIHIESQKQFTENRFSCLIYADSTEIHTIDSLSSLLQHVGTLRKRVNGQGKDDNVNLYYRGELAKWNPIPSLFRNKNNVINEVSNDETIISYLPEEFANCRTDFDRLVKLKHYSEPSRLLDLTKSPLVALFFAIKNMKEYKRYDGVIRVCFSLPNSEKIASISDTVAFITGLSKTDAKKCKICVDKSTTHYNCRKCAEKECEFFNELRYRVQKITGIDYKRGRKPEEEKEMILDDLDRCIVVLPPYNNYRIVQQQGLFIFCGRNKDDVISCPNQILDYWKNPINGGTVFFYIPQSAANDLESELSSLGITDYYIFGNLENEIRSVLPK